VSNVPTRDLSSIQRRRTAPARSWPGLLLLFAGDQAQLTPVPLDAGPLVLGREHLGHLFLDDRKMSRQHAEVRFDRGRWEIRDLGSHNGTYVDGEQVGSLFSGNGRVLRVGGTLFALVEDLRAYDGQTVVIDGDVVLGPRLKRCWSEIDQLAQASDTLHIVGESGVGKELAARRFHQSGPRANGRFVAVNCAAIPPLLAERLLFGTRKGAYSGAESADGYLQAADGGTLFFDEIGELEQPVQAKLLRVIETREVLALGASQPTPIDVAIVSGTHRDLRESARSGRFRSDLLHRLGLPLVRVPPLRSRFEEIPWLIETALQKLDAAVHVSLVEECLLREWPGNIRELTAEVLSAAGAASRAGRKRAGAADLSPDAGQALSSAQADDAILDALRESGGNVTGAARRLGMHRTQLRRWLARHRDICVDE
jgi:transcriptional regulator with GAF, ATPase, and Fis domain